MCTCLRACVYPPPHPWQVCSIDILVEPLGERSVRFAFLLSQKIPAFVPSWVINFVLQVRRRREVVGCDAFVMG